MGLLIAGEGHLKDALQKQIEELQLQNHVRLVGFLKDPRELYRAIDIYVLSSLREGLPNVVLEAMASGRAVVSTSVNGIPRLVTSGENGIVVKSDSVDELFTGIRTVLESDEQRECLAAAGRRTVEGRFSFGTRMQSVVRVYRSLSTSMAQKIQEAATDDVPPNQVTDSVLR